MPRPAAVSAVGGGYLIRVFAAGDTDPRSFNVLVDPGDGVISNLYRAGHAISDIDMVIVTHDHPDHLTALDAILSLRHERSASLPDDGGADEALSDEALSDEDRQTSLPLEDGDERMLILGNESVVNRYSFLNGGGDCVVLHIKDAYSQCCPPLFARGIAIAPLPTVHRDLGGHNAVGFRLELKTEDGAAPLRITIMSDTAIGGIWKQVDGRWEIDARWRKALRSEIVVAHVSDAPSGELRELAGFCDQHPVSKIFDKRVADMLDNGRVEEAMRLMHALSLVRAERKPPPLKLFESGFRKTMEPWQHLFLHGLLGVATEIARTTTDGERSQGERGSGKRVLVVGELREQLGSFRGTIAREINNHVFERSAKHPADDGSADDLRPVALTADIGLRIRLTAEGQQVHCSTCALNNDRLANERYHAPGMIREVCIKGDQEAMYWNCRTHDPSLRESPAFVEHMGSYDTFTAGGQFHG